MFGRLGVSSWGHPGSEARHFLDLSPNGILIADVSRPDMPLTFVNRSFEQITGYTVEEAIGRNCRYLQGEDNDQESVAELRAAIAEGREATVTMRNYTRECRMFWNELRLVALRDRGGRLTHYLGIMRDVTALRDAHHQQEVAATYDRLTGCLNRYAFVDRLNQLIEPERRLLVVKLDLVGFNFVNSGYGHEAGDAMLVQVATRLRRLEAEAVGRVGSNEFAVAFRLEPGTSARKKLGVLKGALAPRYALPGVPADIEAQIAIGYVVGEDGADGTTLFRRAGTALAESKATPLRETREFDRSTANAAKRRVRLIGDIQQGVANREFLYYYQPKVDLSTGAIVGAEALLRWRRPNGMLMLPAEFIDVADDSGLITDIGAVSFPGVAACIRELNAARATPLPLSINVSMTTFRHPRAVEWLGRVVTDSGIEPSLMTLELTEGIMAESSPELIERFRELRALGFGLSIDDFGTGYSSLRYLESFPVSEIKIDRSFVSGLTPDSQKRFIVEAIVRIGLALGATVVGEGVETEEEAQMLRDLGCAEAQGFLFGRPMPAADFLKLMKDR